MLPTFSESSMFHYFCLGLSPTLSLGPSTLKVVLMFLDHMYLHISFTTCPLRSPSSFHNQGCLHMKRARGQNLSIEDQRNDSVVISPKTILVAGSNEMLYSKRAYLTPTFMASRGQRESNPAAPMLQASLATIKLSVSAL